jgi:hypothetical protein
LAYVVGDQVTLHAPPPVSDWPFADPQAFFAMDSVFQIVSVGPSLGENVFPRQGAQVLGLVPTVRTDPGPPAVYAPLPGIQPLFVPDTFCEPVAA